MTKQKRQQNLANSKAFRKGEEFGITFLLHVMAWVLVETEHFPPETVQRIMDEMDDYCEDFGKRNINLRDMAEVLRDEHGITISFGVRKSDQRNPTRPTC